jgi:hypothetical protein
MLVMRGVGSANPICMVRGWLLLTLLGGCGTVCIVGMKTVSIIKNGEFVKSHIDYPVSNVQWKRIDNIVLWDYLTTLHLIDLDNSLVIFQGTLDVFYLRHRHNNDNVTKIDYNSDPWGRKFMMYPSMYYCYVSCKIKIDVNIIMTTVHNMRVYCVDVVKQTV